MKDAPDPTRRQAHDAGPLQKRLAWFVALWLGGVAVVGLVAYAIRAMIL